MLFELMALKRPFMGDNMFAVMHAIINNKVGWFFVVVVGWFLHPFVHFCLRNLTGHTLLPLTQTQRV